MYRKDKDLLPVREKQGENLLPVCAEHGEVCYLYVRNRVRFISCTCETG